jgi:hypothetical protein
LSDNAYQVLGLHKSDYHRLDNPLDWGRSAELREQLVAQISVLESRLAEIEQASEIDYSLRQTCREMIHSRQQQYLQLRR